MPARSSSEPKSAPPEGARPPSGGPPPSKLQLFTAGAATLALVVSSLALFRTIPADRGGTTAPASATAQDNAALQREIEDLQRRVAGTRGGAADPATIEALKRLAKRVEALESKRDPGSKEPADPEAEAAPVLAPGASTPHETALRYAKIDVPQKGISVKETGDGALSVTNTDPSLAGKMVTVSATRTDGTTEEVHLVIPPPQEP